MNTGFNTGFIPGPNAVGFIPGFNNGFGNGFNQHYPAGNTAYAGLYPANFPFGFPYGGFPQWDQFMTNPAYNHPHPLQQQAFPAANITQARPAIRVVVEDTDEPGSKVVDDNGADGDSESQYEPSEAQKAEGSKAARDMLREVLARRKKATAAGIKKSSEPAKRARAITSDELSQARSRISAWTKLMGITDRRCRITRAYQAVIIDKLCFFRNIIKKAENNNKTVVWGHPKDDLLPLKKEDALSDDDITNAAEWMPVQKLSVSPTGDIFAYVNIVDPEMSDTVVFRRVFKPSRNGVVPELLLVFNQAERIFATATKKFAEDSEISAVANIIITLKDPSQ